MSCRPIEKEDKQPNNDRTPSRKAGWEKIAAGIIMLLVAVVTAVRVSTLWKDDWQEEQKKNDWAQMRGNDGRFWQGTPDDGVYADKEGVELRTYYQYFYDKDGRLSKINTFRPHENYEDVWVLSNEETYRYDSRGRVSARQETQGDTKKVYEYTAAGYTETESSSYASAGRVAKYDQAGNQIYFRNAVNYRYPHVTRSEYDEKNRLVRKTQEVEGKEPYGVPEYVIYMAEYDEENYRSVETEYDSQGNIVYIWHSTYDENWSKTESVWYAPEQMSEGYDSDEGAERYTPGRESEGYDLDEEAEAYIPGKESEGYAQDEREEYATMGYWRHVSDGKLLEEMENAPGKEDRNDSEYTAYDYDGNGNCILELKIHSRDYIYLYRYVYDGENRLTERYDYNLDKVRFWEMLQCDGSRLTLQVSDDEVLRITRTAPGGALINRFVYGERDVEIQQTPEEIVSWRRKSSPQETESYPETL